MLILLVKECKTFIRLFQNDAAYWGKKIKGGLGFVKTSTETAINHLIENCCCFNIGNVTVKQAIGTPMGIDPAPFWANLFYIPRKKNTCHHEFLLIKSRQDICTQQSASLMIFAL